MITIEVNDQEVQAALSKLLAATADLTPAFQSIGEALVYSTKQRFVNSEDPDGNAWAENSNLTLSRKRGTAPLIGESKALSTAIHYDAGSDTLVVGSNQEYAAVQQFGAKQHEFGEGKHKAPWGDIPARPFLGINAAEKDAVVRIIEDHIQLAISSAH